MKLHAIIPLLVLALVAGCSANKDRNVSATQRVRNQWNAARAGVLCGLSKQHFENGNLADARKNVDEALHLQPDHVPARLLSARIYIEQGKLDSAKKDLETVLSLDPTSAEASYLMGVIYERWQKPADALKWYSQAAEKAPLEPAYVLARAEMLVGEGKMPEAMTYLREQLSHFENNAPLRDAMGQLLIGARKYAEAVQVLREATIFAPDDALIREHFAFALYYDGKYGEAAPLFDRLTREDKTGRRADLYLAQGECLENTNRLEEARESFQTAARMMPGESCVWVQLAKIALMMNDPVRAEMSLKKAAALDNQNPDICVLAGYLQLKKNRLDEALAAFERAGQLDASDTVSRCMVGYVLEKQGKSKDALKIYGEVLKQRPSDQLASTLMAQVQVHD